MSDEFELVRGESDPLTQARRATELISIYQQRSIELARLRRVAIDRAVEQTGMSLAAVAASVGLSKGRVTQIRQSAPPPERGLFGVGPLTVAIPLRATPGRPLGVIASEDSLGAERLTAYLTGLQFQVAHFQIPINGLWSPPPDAVAICGPKSSSVTAEALDSDPFLTFTADVRGQWSIRDRATEEPIQSPMDSGDMSADVAYVGKLAYRSQRLFVIAGVHALGSLGAVNYLITQGAQVYREAGSLPFSFVLRTVFDGVEAKTHELLTPIRPHV